MRFVSDVNALLSPAEMVEMSGLDFIVGMQEGRLPAPPMCRTLNYWLEYVKEGEVHFRGRPTFDAMNPIGSVHGGWTGTILDSCMACAVQTTLPKGKAYTTLEFKVNILRAVMPDSGDYIARGVVDHCGRRTGMATGELRHAKTGKLYAKGTTSCIVLDPKM